MKKFKRAINKKTCLCALAFLLLFITTLVFVSFSTYAKYSKEVKLSPTWRIEIPAKATGTDPAPQPQEDPHIVTETPNTVYQVQSGDTLSKIAEKFNITIEALAAYNNIENTDSIQVGAILRIPPKDYVPSVSSEPSEQTDNSISEKTENSAAEDSSEPSAAKTENSAAENSSEPSAVKTENSAAEDSSGMSAVKAENSAAENSSEPSTVKTENSAVENSSEPSTVKTENSAAEDSSKPSAALPD